LHAANRSVMIAAPLMALAFAMQATSVLATPSAAAADAQRAVLRPGQAAPSLQSAQLIKGELIRSFSPGRTYVVEFWATWCEPCKRSMPHLSELARQYQGRVTFIAVDSYEQSSHGTVTEAKLLAQVQRFVQGKGRDLDMNVVMDDASGTLASHWLEAAEQGAIPVAFVVHDGRVVWIGEPQDVAQPLAEILAGRYDLQAALVEFAQGQADGLEIRRLWDYPPYAEAVRRDDYTTQISLRRQAFAMNPRLEMRQSMGMGLFPLLLHVDEAQARLYAREYIKRYDAQFNDPVARSELLMSLAGAILYDPKLRHPDLKFALQLAQESFAMAPTKGVGDYSSLAAALFANGNRAKAIELQQQAVAAALRIPEYDPAHDRQVARQSNVLKKYQGSGAVR
jgi:thiol-disulfide isomerase/thioredoxin